MEFFESLRTVTYDNAFFVALFRLLIATLCGGAIGLERGRKRRPAGFRTHMLVCTGAALTMLCSQYIAMMETQPLWTSLIHATGDKFTDVSRLGAQVVNGVGFLGAGTIIVTGQQEVKGLTTAAGLWAAACMGLAIGAGFVEGALVGSLLIILTIVVFSRFEHFVVSHARNINLYVEFLHVDDVGAIISAVKAQEVRIFDVEIHKSRGDGTHPGAVFSVRLPKHMKHETVLAVVAAVENVRAIEEL